jgi:hypothetical protein
MIFCAVPINVIFRVKYKVKISSFYQNQIALWDVTSTVRIYKRIYF